MSAPKGEPTPRPFHPDFDRDTDAGCACCGDAVPMSHVYCLDCALGLSFARHCGGFAEAVRRLQLANGRGLI